MKKSELRKIIREELNNNQLGKKELIKFLKNNFDELIQIIEKEDIVDPNEIDGWKEAEIEIDEENNVSMENMGVVITFKEKKSSGYSPIKIGGKTLYYETWSY